MIEKHLLAGIREITGYVQANEDEFVERIEIFKPERISGHGVQKDAYRMELHRRVHSATTT